MLESHQRHTWYTRGTRGPIQTHRRAMPAMLFAVRDDLADFVKRFSKPLAESESPHE